MSADQHTRVGWVPLTDGVLQALAEVLDALGHNTGRVMECPRCGGTARVDPFDTDFGLTWWRCSYQRCRFTTGHVIQRPQLSVG